MQKRLWEKGEGVHPEVLRFTVGNDPMLDTRIVRWDAIASAAHAKMLEKIGVLSAADLSSLLKGLQSVVEQADAGEFVIPLELEDCHSAIEAFLLEQVGEAGRKIHTGRSRNDQVLVAVRLYLRNQLLSLLGGMNQLIDGLYQRIETDGATHMPGYTHLQAAMPSSVGMWLGSFVELCLSLEREGLSLLELVDENPLGAASGFGVPLPLDREYTAELLGFSRVQRNPVSVQSSRGRHELQALRWCVDVGSVLEKLACDLMLYSTEEYGFFSLPTELTTGSSIMPQKHNPDVLELLRARAGKLHGAEAELQSIIGKLPSHYHRDYQYTKEPLIRSFENVHEMLSVATVVVAAFEVNSSALEAKKTQALYATYDAYAQVREGMPFRDAYRNTAEKFKAGKIDIKKLEGDFELIRTQLTAELQASRAEWKTLRDQLSARERVEAQAQARAFEC